MMVRHEDGDSENAIMRLVLYVARQTEDHFKNEEILKDSIMKSLD